MLKGIHLTLLVGAGAPQIAPQEVIDALESVEVNSGGSAASGFQLTFRLGKRSPLHTRFLLFSTQIIRDVRVIIVVTINGAAQVIIDGIMTHHSATPNADGSTTISITGEDLTRLMDRSEFTGFPFFAMPPVARVAAILAKYAALGIIPMVVPSLSSIFPNPASILPRQEGTDLEYVRELAQRAGYVFYLEPSSQPGRSTAYWGPPIRRGPVQPALTTNTDAHTNVESINFSFDRQGKTIPFAWIREPFFKTIVPVPLRDPVLLSPPLAEAVPVALSTRALRDASRLSLVEAAESLLSAASRSSHVVSASGSLNVLRYGRVLAPRKLVAVRGAGSAFDGLYYVEQVSHHISRGQYRQQFQLNRDGLVSTVRSISA